MAVVACGLFTLMGTASIYFTVALSFKALIISVTFGSPLGFVEVESLKSKLPSNLLSHSSGIYHIVINLGQETDCVILYIPH